MDPQQNEIILFEHQSFKEAGRIRRIIITDFAEGNLHSLHGPLDFKDCLSSLKWRLDSGITVTFHEDHDGNGRKFPVTGTGEDADTHNNNFKDCASAFSWSRA